jgi:hypothetical protein
VQLKVAVDVAAGCRFDTRHVTRLVCGVGFVGIVLQKRAPVHLLLIVTAARATDYLLILRVVAASLLFWNVETLAVTVDRVAGCPVRMLVC